MGKTQRKAFTLAEVLITLGIIGVVAAMTIPTLMQKTNDKELVAGTLKMGTTLSNALKGFEAVDSVSVDKLSDLSSFNAGLTKQLKTTACTDHAVCLADGSYFDYANENFGDICNKTKPCVEIIANINGRKGPDKQGKDVYKFLVTNRGIVPACETDTCTGLDCTAYVMATHKLWDGELTEVNIEAQEEEVATPKAGDSCEPGSLIIYTSNDCGLYCEIYSRTWQPTKGCN